MFGMEQSIFGMCDAVHVQLTYLSTYLNWAYLNYYRTGLKKGFPVSWNRAKFTKWFRILYGAAHILPRQINFLSNFTLPNPI